MYIQTYAGVLHGFFFLFSKMFFSANIQLNLLLVCSTLLCATHIGTRKFIFDMLLTFYQHTGEMIAKPNIWINSEIIPEIILFTQKYLRMPWTSAASSSHWHWSKHFPAKLRQAVNETLEADDSRYTGKSVSLSRQKKEKCQYISWSRAL